MFFCFTLVNDWRPEIPVLSNSLGQCEHCEHSSVAERAPADVPDAKFVKFMTPLFLSLVTSSALLAG
jgi:hypothetical protein